MATTLPAPTDPPGSRDRGGHDLPRADQRRGAGPGETLRLCDLAPGERARVSAVDPAGDPGGRLADLGFLPGTEVALLRRAPLGDPAVYALRGTRFCLRASQAAAVLVVRADPKTGHHP